MAALKRWIQLIICDDAGGNFQSLGLNSMSGYCGRLRLPDFAQAYCIFANAGKLDEAPALRGGPIVAPTGKPMPITILWQGAARFEELPVCFGQAIAFAGVLQNN